MDSFSYLCRRFATPQQFEIGFIAWGFKSEVKLVCINIYKQESK